MERGGGDEREESVWVFGVSSLYLSGPGGLGERFSPAIERISEDPQLDEGDVADCPLLAALDV
jgi:hypothetical protein